MDYQSEQKFQILKKNLDSLHYSQPFTIESAALVERLFNDLLKTTEGFQGLKRVNDEVKTQLIKSENQIQPLKFENHKLVKENNEMHVAMIKTKEEAEYKGQ